MGELSDSIKISKYPLGGHPIKKITIYEAKDQTKGGFLLGLFFSLSILKMQFKVTQNLPIWLLSSFGVLDFRSCRVFFSSFLFGSEF